jgi:hypothetical protein
VVAGEQGALPDGALVAFAVAEQYEDLVRSAGELAAQRDAATEREAVPQRAGEDIDARGAVLSVSPAGFVEAEGVELVERKKPRSASTG